MSGDQRLTFYYGPHNAEATFTPDEAESILAVLRDTPNANGFLTLTPNDGDCDIHILWRSIDSIKVRPA